MPYAEALSSLAPSGSLQLSSASESPGRGVDAATQMANLLAYAEANHGGASTGQCFQYVWRYIHSSGYGRIENYGDCPAMGSAEARMFAEFMNSGTHAADWGIVRLSGSTPYDAPAGSVVVVGPGSPGTSHATAGDIAVARGDGTFINDGPQMNYGPPERFLADGGSLLGIYAPAG
ncbi:MAG: hypothetical protein ACPGU1_13470 [Myxococcota bacterium]